MLAYHGSLDIIKSPEILTPNRTLDYGKGFYLTTSESQAVSWVLRKMDESHQVGYVNIYEIDETIMNSLKVLYFDYPSEEWLDFVMKNRTDSNFDHDFDIVFGPVANDRVYASFSLYEAGFITKSELIKELKTYKLVDQFLFHTQKSLNILSFVEAKEVRK